MNKELEQIIKKLKGNLIGIGIKEEKILKLIEKNDNILECNLLDCFEPDTKGNGKNKKIINLRKKFKKRKTNYIICNFDRIKEIENKIIYDTIYICNKEIFIYDKEKQELENLTRRYSRYANVEILNYKEGNIYKITIKKNISKINEIYYKIIDNLISLIDFISNLLT